MGYNIEISFNVLKHTSVSKILEHVKELAQSHYCSYYYEDYDFEYKTQYQRSHGIVTINFSHPNIYFFIGFLRNIQRCRELYIEVIYDDVTSSILYASQYYITQKMDKGLAKSFTKSKRERSYSDDDNMILDAVKKSK
jgi:hypothetical protein